MQTLVPSLVPPPKPLPPLPPKQIVEARQVGARLIKRYRAGILIFVNRDRDKAQVKQIADVGYLTRKDGTVAAVQLGTLRTLDRLTARSTRQKPTELLSLYRPPRTPQSQEPHGRGQGLDIAAFGGYTIDSRTPGQAVAGVVSIINALGPRSYRLGLPKPYGSDPHGLEPPRPRTQNWPFFPPPLPRVIRIFGAFRVVMPYRNPSGQFVQDKRGNFLRPEILHWENERSAPLGEVGSPTVRQAIVRARRRGAQIHLLFPDATNHLHIDVKE